MAHSILVAEDSPVSAKILKRLLSKAGYEVTVVHDRMAALAALGRGHYDALLTDWMMPKLDGAELCRRVRMGAYTIRPIVVMLTSIVSEEARFFAMEAGADEYLSKPYQREELLGTLESLLARRSGAATSDLEYFDSPLAPEEPPVFPALVIIGNTDAPAAIIAMMRGIRGLEAAVFCIVPSPMWILETFQRALEQTTNMPVIIPEESEDDDDVQEVTPGTIYLAPPGRHLKINAKNMALVLEDSPPVNYLRPSADVFFRSAAATFGHRMVLAVVTGMGVDGVEAARIAHSIGATVFVQSPETCASTTLPLTVVDKGYSTVVAKLADLARVVPDRVRQLIEELKLD